MDREKQIWGKIVSRCWIDEAFKKKLMKNPADAFKGNGLEVPSGTSVVVHQDTEKVRNWVLPLKPQEELIEEELGGVIKEVVSNKHDDNMC